MKKIIKISLAITAIGVAVKVANKKKEDDRYSSWLLQSRNQDEGMQQMVLFLKERKRTYIAHEWLGDRIFIYSKPRLIH